MRWLISRSRAGLAILAMAGLSSCETTQDLTKKFGVRQEKSSVRSSFGFDEEMWAGQGGGNKEDEKKMRSKWADAGWTLDDDGNIKGAKNENLYSGESRDAKKRFGTKAARLGDREVTREVYRTPEYLERQEFRDSKKAREGALVSREANFDGNRAGEAGVAARESGESPGFLQGLNPFRTKTARASNQRFQTSANREASRAQADAAVPNAGRMPRDGNMARSAMTMDDVKKMLAPESYD